ncbi:hypothetical protein Bca52824_016814 [Brassica carinata]|uniref:DUF4378 domain-containing protein n=1 Tax=Brassica carinata TaxID=52824 RepID=A0A8X7W4R7_BRACI|nr:hypothetical protein Bca52824_016814 [Brassica carinata]
MNLIHEFALVMSDLRKAKETMRRTVAGDMSQEVEDRHASSTNLVAKLMGLDTTAAAPRSSRSRSYSPSSLSSKDIIHQAQNCCHRKFQDGYERWVSLPHLSRKGHCDASMSDSKKLDLVRRKFMEAKRLVTDDKLHGSKEFQEALHVLSSNKDLFVELLQESNSLYSHDLSDFQPGSPHPDAKRITVLRPQKCIFQDSRGKQVKKTQETGWTDAAQPTRIVVLKPSPAKALDINAIAPSFFDEAGDAETRQVAKEITRQIRETFRGHCMNETLSSSSSSYSLLSNGYLCDDGSLNAGNSEIMSPSSRHSWDCGNRFETPPFSSRRVSFSPESSVYREAKKRLSERWAMMSLNGDTHQQQKNLPKVSTALGDMLALSETKVPTRFSEESNKAKQESRRSVSCIGSGLDQVEIASDSPLNTLERSKSVPEIRLNGGTSVSGTSKAQAHRALTESRSLKSSWKVPGLFFFRNKKANKEKTDPLSQLPKPTDALQRRNVFTREGEVTILNENQDQPSPVSVLRQPFEEEHVGNPECSVATKPWTSQGEEKSLKSSLIDKSPPIGSIARVFSWEDESYTDITKPGNGIKEDEDWYYFIKTLLKASGFSGSDPFMTPWHSPDSPLDPSLRDKFANKEPIKRRNQRSNRKLVFDCVSAIITGTTSTAARTGLTSGFDMVEHVWTEFKDWVVEDANNLEGESLVREEVVGKMWTHNLQVEVNNWGVEIEVILLQELIEEAVFDLTQ